MQPTMIKLWWFQTIKLELGLPSTFQNKNSLDFSSKSSDLHLCMKLKHIKKISKSQTHTNKNFTHLLTHHIYLLSPWTGPALGLGDTKLSQLFMWLKSMPNWPANTVNCCFHIGVNIEP